MSMKQYIAQKKAKLNQYLQTRDAKIQAQRKQDDFQRKIDAQSAREELKQLRDQARYKREIQATKDYKRAQSQAKWNSIIGSAPSASSDGIMGPGIFGGAKSSKSSDPFASMGGGSRGSADPFAAMYGPKPRAARKVKRKRRR